MQVKATRVREIALQHGYHVHSHRGGYLIATADTNCVVAGGGPVPYNMTLGDVMEWLAS
ncbi:hypothetical protein [Mycobacterium canetti]|uniref:hypothetical protein n=1 Tax=Mycobacterium canetti TaxID=78331 RepID=UPI0013054618|nr:hypothetical protein [Mycobacterium canetti]MBA2788277.1 hypothetical protein [Mycobacterium canetti]